MKKYILIALMSVVVIISKSAFADHWHEMEKTKVTKYLVDGGPAGEQIYVEFEGTPINPHGECPNSNVSWKRIMGDSEKGKYLFSLIVTAKVTGQLVTLRFAGCDNLQRNIIIGIYVE